MNVLVRDLPDDVHRKLVDRAERSGQSLQQFLRAELEDLARRESLEEVLSRINRRRGGSIRPDEAAAMLREDRGR